MIKESKIPTLCKSRDEYLLDSSIGFRPIKTLWPKINIPEDLCKFLVKWLDPNSDGKVDKLVTKSLIDTTTRSKKVKKGIVKIISCYFYFNLFSIYFIFYV